MPLIRYKTGDFFEMSNNTCECGRIFPIVKKIYGRSEKGFQLSNGRKIVFLDHAFKTIPNLMEAQIVQKNADKFIVNLVLNDSFDDKYLEVIFKDLVDRMGDVDISFNKVDHIQRGKNGKFEFLKVDIDE
jgi:phenylacetate-CoA ligase